MLNPVKKTRKPSKVVDETTQVRCALGKDHSRGGPAGFPGKVVKCNLAFTNHSLLAEDNGRVLGEDNGHHHRHYAGAEEKFAFVGCEKLVERFLNEVRRLCNKKDPI